MNTIVGSEDPDLIEGPVIDLEAGNALGVRRLPSLWRNSLDNKPQLRPGAWRLARPLDELIAYQSGGFLGLRFAPGDRSWYRQHHPFLKVPEVEIALPRQIAIDAESDLRRIFFTEINPHLTKPLLPPLEHQYQQAWQTGSEATWTCGSMDGEFRDASAIVRVVAERHGIQCTSGILMFWMMTATKDYAPRLELSPFDVVRYGSFREFTDPVLEDLKETLRELEPGLLARNHPYKFSYRSLRKNLDQQDLLAPYRAASFEEIPVRMVIAVEAAQMAGSSFTDAMAIVDEIAALSRKCRETLAANVADH